MPKSPLRILTASLLAASLFASSAGVASAQQHQHNRSVGRAAPQRMVVTQRSRHYSNRNVGIGIAAAIVAGTVIAGSAYANGRLSCRSLERRCDDGQDWACHQLDIRADC